MTFPFKQAPLRKVEWKKLAEEKPPELELLQLRMKDHKTYVGWRYGESWDGYREFDPTQIEDWRLHR